MTKVALFGQVVRQRVDVSPFARPFPLLPLRRSPSPEVDDDRARQLIDDPTLDRIINAVGRPFKGNRNALRHDLLNCYRKYTIASGPGSSKLNKRQVNRLTSISNHAKKLVELLQEDEDTWTESKAERSSQGGQGTSWNVR